MKILQRLKVAFSALRQDVGDVLTGTAAHGRRATGPRVGDAWLEAYNAMPWLRAVVSKIAFGVASLEWGIARTMAQGKTVRRKDLQHGQFDRRQKVLSAMVDDGTAEAVFEHPALDLLADPCPLLEGKAFWMLVQVYYEIPGEVFLLLERNGPPGPTGRKQPTALFPIPPTWVTRTPTPDRPTFDIERGTLRISDIPKDEMWWLKNADPVNPYARGVGGSLSLSDELDADESAAKMFSWSFHNRGQGDMLVSLEGAGKKDLDAFRNAWQANLLGVQNALKTHFVNWKVEVQQLSHDFQHLQVMDFRRFSRDMIRQVHGVPPEILGITESSNRATIDAADFLFGKHVIVPRAEIWREFLQERLIPEFDDRAVLDYVSPLSEDKEFALKATAISPHVFRVNELRRLAGFDPIPEADGGSLFFVNGTTHETLADVTAPAAPGAPGAFPPGGSSHVEISIPTPPGLERPKVAIELGAGLPIQKKIEHRPGEELPWVVLSEDGTEVLGRHATEAEALAQLAAIEAAQNRRNALVHMKASPDEATAIARWARRCGYSLNFDLLAETAPIPVSSDRRVEYLRRSLARLRGDSTAGWDSLLGKWDATADDMLDRMLAVKGWTEAA